MHRNVSVILCKLIGFFFVSILYFGISTQVLAFSGSGSGTSGDPYQITTCALLQEMNLDKAAHYQIMNSFDCIGIANFTPIGTSAAPFTGTLTGNALYTIDNLNMQNATTSSTQGMGLIGTSNGATITQIHLTNLHYVANAAAQMYNVGGIVGYMVGGTLTNCTTSGTIERTNTGWDLLQAGGIIGELMGTGGVVNNSSSSVNVSSVKNGGYLGGFIGRTRGTGHLIEDSHATGGVTGGEDSSNLGGFIGHLAGEVTINRAYATGAVSNGSADLGTALNIGGFAGVICSSGFASGLGAKNINDSYSTGNVTMDGNNNYGTGGFVGYLCDNATIDNSYATGIVSTHNNLLAYNNPQVGGFVGYVTRNYTANVAVITNSYATGAVNGGGMATQVGGFVGELRQGSISNSYSTGHVTIYDEVGGGAIQIGGFVGDMGGSDSNLSSITNCYSTGNVSQVNGISRYFGGFAGYISSYNSTIDKSYSTGAVSGTSWSGSGGYRGGFIGYLNIVAGGAVIINNTYARGNVANTAGFTNEYVGGYVGQAVAGTINNSYSTGTVTSTLSSTNLGGFAGAVTSPTVTSSYWDTESSGVATSAIGSGLTTTQLKDSSNLTGWDFATIPIWYLNSSFNNGYPSFTAPSPTPTPTPTTAATTTTTTTVLPGSTTNPPVSCNDPAPAYAPDLFNAVRSGKNVTLSFTPVIANTSGYDIFYGPSSTELIYSTSFTSAISSGVIQYSIGSLSPNQAYSFQVRAVNNCVPGPWSNILTVSKSGIITITPTPTPTDFLTPTPTPTETPTPTPTPTPTTTDTITVTNTNDTQLVGVSVTLNSQGKGGGKPKPTPTLTPSPTIEPTPTATPSATPTETPTSTPTPSPTETVTPSPTATPTESPSPSLTETVTPTEPATTSGTVEPPLAEGRTDLNGEFTFDLPAGNYDATVRVGGMSYTVPVVLAADGTDINISVPVRTTPSRIVETEAAIIGADIALAATVGTITTTTAITETLIPVYATTGRSLLNLPVDLVKGLVQWVISFISSGFFFMTGLVMKKRKSGTSFISTTDAPLAGTFILLYSESGNIKSGFTDQLGQYSMEPEPDVYSLKAQHVGYSFPSQLIKTKESALYSNIYLPGEKITVSRKGDSVAHSVPLDPSREINPLYRLTVILKNFNGFILSKLYSPVLLITMGITAIASYFDPTLFNLGALAITLVLTFGNMARKAFVRN